MTIYIALKEIKQRDNIYISNTSGSSGKPLFFAKDRNSHSMSYAIIEDRMNWHNLKLNSKEARFWGIPLENISYYKEKLKDLLMNRVRFSVFDLSDQILNKFYEKFKKTKFEYIYGYTNSLVIFSKFLIKKKKNLKEICPSLK